MRTMILAVAISFSFCGAAVADDEPKAGQPAVTLRLGDPAPPLKVSKWLTGQEVSTFAPGKVYVVEFWATWCGPCVVMMPHLGDMQEQLGPKGVTIIGFTVEDPNNKLEKVVEFLHKRGDKLGYTVAFADDQTTKNAYMKAAGKGGIPCSFVIGGDGKIAYIGHPMFLDEVMPKVLDGTWDAVKGTAELEVADKQWDSTYAAMRQPGDPAKQLAEWQAFHDKFPRLSTDPYMTSERLKLLVKAKQTANARQLADSVVAKALKRNDIIALNRVSEAMATAEDESELAAIGVRAAEAALAIDGETADTLIRVAKAHGAAQNTAKMQEFGTKAVTAAEKAISGEKDVRGTLRLAAAHDAAGDKAKAKAAAEKAVSFVDAKDVGMKRFVDEQAKKYGVEPKAADK